MNNNDETTNVITENLAKARKQAKRILKIRSTKILSGQKLAGSTIIVYSLLRFWIMRKEFLNRDDVYETFLNLYKDVIE